MSNNPYQQPPYVEKRPRYFDGQYLQVSDFLLEQQYHIDRQRRNSQFLQVSGILEGLNVTIDANKTRLIIKQGRAIDDQGQQILLSNEAQFEAIPSNVKTTLSKLTPSNQFEIDLSDISKFPRNQPYHLWITWEQVETDPQTEGGGTENTRFYERPKLLLQPSQNQSPASSVFLALLNSASDGFTIGTSDRLQYSGLKLPASNNNGVTLRSQNGAGDRAVLTGSLNVAGSLSVMGVSSFINLLVDGTLAVAGNSTLTGSLTVNNKVSLTGSANTTGLSVSTNGNVGIGTTTTPSELLEIQRTGNSNFLSIYNSGTDANQESRIVWKNGANRTVAAAIASRPGTSLNAGELRFQTAKNSTLENRLVLNESGVYENNNPSAYPNYEIHIRGSANESSEQDTPSFNIKGQTISFSSSSVNRGIYTIILSPDGTSKAQNKHDVFSASNWNTWADWVSTTAREGDVVAVASQDALNAVPSTGSAEKLLRSILAVRIFEVQQYIDQVSVIRRPYTLLFIVGRSNAIEVLQPYKGSNAHIRTTYYDLLRDSSGSCISGMIMMWSGSANNIPIGWALCNGQQGTPDLRDRFIVAAGSNNYAPGNTGEPDSHTHSINPPSTNLTINSGGGHTHALPSAWFQSRCRSDDKGHTVLDVAGQGGPYSTQSDGSHSHTGSVDIAEFTSSSSSGLNRPKWYALCFIMKL